MTAAKPVARLALEVVRLHAADSPWAGRIRNMVSMFRPIGKLALEDGTVFTGRGFGAIGEAAGEVCFNTSMTGYQEVLTDPSYAGQIVTMTYPLIGNVGVNSDDRESRRPCIEGFVVRELCRRPSNYRSQMPLHDYLAEQGIAGLEGIDTRALVRRLRVRGAMTGVLSSVDDDDVSLVAKARSAPSLVGRDLVRGVVPAAAFAWEPRPAHPLTAHLLPARTAGPHVVALDYGMKWNIARFLAGVGCRVTVVPGTASAADVLALKPDGVFLSNGPGDPEPLGYATAAIRELTGRVPIFGICLGLQLLGLSFGAKTFKLKFGHRGANQPVLNRRTGRVEITTQNHGFAVDAASLPDELEATHVNLNDQTLEGFRHKRLPIFGVQYHPESSAGPHDSVYLFEEFRASLS